MENLKVEGNDWEGEREEDGNDEEGEGEKERGRQMRVKLQRDKDEKCIASANCICNMKPYREFRVFFFPTGKLKCFYLSILSCLQH